MNAYLHPLPISSLIVLLFSTQIYGFPNCWIQVKRGSVAYVELQTFYAADAKNPPEAKGVEEGCVSIAQNVLRKTLQNYCERVEDETACEDAKAEFVVDLYVDYPSWGILNDHHVRFDGCGVEAAGGLEFKPFKYAHNLQRCKSRWGTPTRQQELATLFASGDLPQSESSKPNCEISLRSRYEPIRPDNYSLFTRKVSVEGEGGEREKACTKIGGEFMGAFLKHYCHDDSDTILCDDLKANYFVEAATSHPKLNKLNDGFHIVHGCTGAKGCSLNHDATASDIKGLLQEAIVQVFKTRPNDPRALNTLDVIAFR